MTCRTKGPKEACSILDTKHCWWSWGKNICIYEIEDLHITIPWAGQKMWTDKLIQTGVAMTETEGRWFFPFPLASNFCPKCK